MQDIILQRPGIDEVSSAVLKGMRAFKVADHGQILMGYRLVGDGWLPCRWCCVQQVYLDPCFVSCIVPMVWVPAWSWYRQSGGGCVACR